MRFEYKLISLFLFLSLLYTNCGPTGYKTSYNSTYSYTPVPGVIGGNTMTLTVGAAYANSLTANVQVCVPGTATCQTISNLLIDTGSTGLRIFSSKLTVATPALLTTATDSYGNLVGNCAVYGDSSYHWGPVKSASVTLGTEAAVAIPIQVIDYTFGDSGAACRASAGTAVTEDVATPTYSGILGVKFFKQDCGASCLTNSVWTNPSYFGCNAASGASCGVIAFPLTGQIQNPIAALAGDNNGYVIDLPSVTSTGGLNVTGTLYLGVGTQSNNMPVGSVTRFSADPSYGSISAVSNGSTITAIVDSGSNGSYFQYSGMTTCGSFYCPASQMTIPVRVSGSSGSSYLDTSVLVGNYTALVGTGNNSFNNIAGPIPTGLAGYFDFGLSFFLGRKIYYGIENTATALGNGPYIGF